MSKTFVGAFLLLFLFTPAFSLAGGQFERRTNGVILEVPEGFLDVQFYSDSIVRVAFAKNRNFFKRQTIDIVDQPATGVQWALETAPQSWNLKGKQLSLSIDRTTGKVRFLDSNGTSILTEDSRQLEPAQVQGEKTFHIHQQWQANPDESLYGLGQNQFGMLDLKGTDLDLWQHNTNVAVPFLVSSSGYGILWDNTSFTRFGDLREFIPIPAEYLYSRDNKPGGLTTEPLDHSEPISQTAVIDIDLQPKHGEPRPASTRWEGFIEAPVMGDYQFDARSNGGIKVWLDGKLIMDHWRQGWLTDHDRAKVSLQAGKHYPLKIEWDTEQGTALNFCWKPPVPKKRITNSLVIEKGAWIDTAKEMPGGISETLGFEKTFSSPNIPTVQIGETKSQTITSLWSEVGDGIDYYFVYGPELDKVVAGYRVLTGQAPMMPNWAFGLWQ